MNCFPISFYECSNVPSLWLSRQISVDNDQINILLENNRGHTTHGIIIIFNISKSSAGNHLHELDYVSRFDECFPLKLNGGGTISNALYLNVQFVKQILQVDEKWIIYNHIECNKSWGKENEPPPTLPKPAYIRRCVCDEIGKEFSTWEFFRRTNSKFVMFLMVSLSHSILQLRVTVYRFLLTKDFLEDCKI